MDCFDCELTWGREDEREEASLSDSLLPSLNSIISTREADEEEAIEADEEEEGGESES